MKTFLIILAFFSMSYASIGQQSAITQNGEEVILYENGTWQYKDADLEVEIEIPLNPDSFEKDGASTFLVKSNVVDLGIWINPKEWVFKKAENNPDSEYEFQFKEGDLYGMLITEKIPIPIETLRSIALENGRLAAPDLKVVKEEYRIVNGLKVLFLQMNGSLQGIKFSYYGYYYSSDSGTIQFITYTSQNLLEEYWPKCDVLLNGLVETKE